MRKQLLLFLLALLPLAASADSSGTCGAGLKWTYVEATKTLTISGQGEMYNYSNTDFSGKWAPWRNIGFQTLIIESGVTSIGNYAFYFSSLTSVTIPNSVTSIGNGAFEYCKSLTSVTISNSVTSIGKSVFECCSSLTSVIIPNSVTSIGERAFMFCRSLATVTIPNSIKSIGYSAFSYCSGLTTVTIPGSVACIQDETFENCSSLASVTIGNGVDSIGWNAFQGCSNVKSITIPNSVIYIGNRAFYNCDSLNSLTIGDNLTGFSSDSFQKDYKYTYHKIYVRGGTKALLALWSAGLSAYDVNTGQYLKRPYTSSTQTTATINLGTRYSEYTYTYNGNPVMEDVIKFTGLMPGKTYTAKLIISMGDVTYTPIYSFETKSISPSVWATTTASSVKISCSYTKGDAEVTDQWLTINGKQVDMDNVYLKGLAPGSSREAVYYVKVKYGENGEYTNTYSSKRTITTKALTMTTLQPKVISSGNVIVAAESNLDDEETNVGFEWRRTDWTDDFSSNTGRAFLYGGKMEGYIRNLNTEKLWKYRPYYLSDSGTYYYGDWVGLDPTNTSYFEPTVHTYSTISITGNTALVKGYALTGTDGIKVQGFKYWKKTTGAKGSAEISDNAMTIPAGAFTVEASGQVMTASLTDLDYSTEYHYVAFATTTAGDTFYGEEQTFTTGGDPTGIQNAFVDEPVRKANVIQGIFTLQGVKMSDNMSDWNTLPSGIYIVNGRKVMK